MAKTKISEFSSTPGNNTDIDSINISEGCAPSGINDAIRELMAQLKDFQTGAAGDSFNGPVGTITAAAGAFTTLTASSTATLNTLASSGATLTGGTINGTTIGGTTAAAVSATTLTTSSTVTHNGGTANGVAYLNGSKVLTTGSALTFDGSQLDIPAGTAAAPSLSTIADANTGIFFPAADTIAFAEGGAEAMRINSSGNVGIGTDSPTVRLQVSSATASQIYATDTTSGNTAQMFASSAGAVFGSFTNADVQIRTNNTERLRITAAGNVGIGTSSPGAKLDVAGAIRTTAGSDPGTFTALYDGNLASYEIAFRTGLNNARTEQMRLDSSGNLGLGVTPSAWGSGFRALQLNSQTALFGSVDSTFLQTNAYINSAGSNLYIGTGFATRYRQDGGTHQWHTAPSGTAGNAISFTQALSLTAAGNLLLGGTTDPGGTKVLYIGNGTTPGTPTSGGVLYVESGALKYKGSSGTVTTLGAA